MRPKLHLLTYSNNREPYFGNAAYFCERAMASDFSSATHVTEDELKKTPFWAENEATLTQSRGAGYWLWKPHLIRESLRTLGEDDILIYSDAGRGLKYQNNYFDTYPGTLASIVQKLPKGYLAGYTSDWMTQARFTKADCFALMNADTPEMHNAPQVATTWSLWRPTPEALDFVDEWLRYCCDPRVLTDLDNQTDAKAQWDFQDHRHDQSIASILAHRNRAHYIALHQRDLKAAFFEIRDNLKLSADVLKSLRNIDRVLSVLYGVEPGEPIRSLDDHPTAIGNLKPGEPIPDRSDIRDSSYPAFWVQEICRLTVSDPQSIEWKHIWPTLSASRRKAFKLIIKGKRRPEVDSIRAEFVELVRSHIEAIPEDQRPHERRDVRKMLEDIVMAFAEAREVEIPPDGWALLLPALPTVDFIGWRIVFYLGGIGTVPQTKAQLGEMFAKQLALHGGDQKAAYRSIRNRFEAIQRELAESPTAAPPLARWHAIWRATPQPLRTDWGNIISRLKNYDVLTIVDASVAAVREESFASDAQIPAFDVQNAVDAARRARSELGR